MPGLNRHEPAHGRTVRRAAWIAVVALAAAATPSAADDSFERSVAPILTTRCLECHNASDKAGGLDLSTRAGLLTGGDSGAAIEPGDTEASFLLQRVADGEMPPPKQGKPRPLATAEVETLRDWIKEGAAWPEGRALDLFAATTTTRGGRDWWSLQPIRRVAPPVFPGTELVNNPIDAFIRAPLEAKGWQAAPEADRRTLIRRVYDDLLGLPPTFEEIEAFAADPAPDAYERLVDRLLASPHFGERWGRHWLDVARYAETCGYERDQEKPNAWRYRDWVIDAFNADTPFDRFAREQIAGDEVPDRSESSVVATGFLRLGTWNDEPNDPNEYKYERLEDMVHAASTAFLGLTIKCARCHDHKFDPIRQSDYYRMAGAFWAGPIEPGPGQLLGGPDAKALGFEGVLGWTDRGRDVPPLPLLKKGDPNRPGPAVDPAPPSFLPALDRPFSPPPPGAGTTHRRRQLADWITDVGNPLPARVWANRVWLHHMGQGLVRSPDNFGFTGEKPTHPDLLDWLASELIRDGWTTKRLHRLIVTSRTYKQASVHPRQADYEQVDSGNRLWWRAERRRRDAESLRDALLAAPGSLDRSHLGGPSVKPVIAPDALEGLSMKTAAWQPSPPEMQRRRSVYLYAKRALLSPLLTTFDFMDTTLPCGQRDVTLVAPQALALMNNAFAHERSRELAQSIQATYDSDDPRIRAAWRRALGREPRPEELALARDHLARQRQRFTSLLAHEPDLSPPTGAVLHLAADRGLTLDASGRVESWSDLSNSGHDARQPLPSARPHLAAESPAAVRFDGVDDFLQLTGQVLSSQRFSLFAVVRDRGGSGHRTLFSNWDGAAGNSTTSIFLGTTGAGSVRLSDDFTAPNALDDVDRPFLLSAIASDHDAAVFLGQSKLAGKGAPLSTRNLQTPFVIGQQGNIQGEWWRGDLVELFVYNRALDDAEREAVATHLERRHALSTDERLDAETLALASLCHVLLNSNEFLYVD